MFVDSVGFSPCFCVCSLKIKLAVIEYCGHSYASCHAVFNMGTETVAVVEGRRGVCRLLLIVFLLVGSGVVFFVVGALGEKREPRVVLFNSGLVCCCVGSQEEEFCVLRYDRSFFQIEISTHAAHIDFWDPKSRGECSLELLYFF